MYNKKKNILSAVINACVYFPFPFQKVLTTENKCVHIYIYIF